MRYSTVALAAISASEVLAGPVRHVGHQHKHKKDLSDVDWNDPSNYAGVDWTKIDYTGGHNNNNNGGAPAPAPSGNDNHDNPIAALVSTVTSSVHDDGIVGSLIANIKGFSNSLTEFGSGSNTDSRVTAQSGAYGDAYIGNPGSPYCSNVIKVASTEGYEYTNNVINTSGKEASYIIWNKVGSDGQTQSGGALVAREACLTFTLQPGENQIVAFQENSQVGMAEAVADHTMSGHVATSFCECNFTNTGAACNLSAILNKNGNTYKMKISNAQNDCVSDQEQNCWPAEFQHLPGLDGVDRNGNCYIGAGQGGTFTTEMGGQQ